MDFSLASPGVPSIGIPPREARNALGPFPRPRSLALQEKPRVGALDAARSLAVFAMVMGHTLDAVLSPAARRTPAIILYWQARGFTAPLFLVVSGWAVTLAITRSGVRGWKVLRERLPRVLLLLAMGYVLRWPGWALDRFAAGDREVWAHFLAFDALHCIGTGLLVTSLLLAIPAGWIVRAGMLVTLAIGAVWIPTVAPAPGAGPHSVAPFSVVSTAFAQALGGSSPFPMLPWLAYFVAGSLVGLLVPPGRRSALAMVTAASIAIAVLRWFGLSGRPPNDPVLVMFRIAVVLALLGGLAAVPSALASKLAPLGKQSLAVYALHIPIVYGWSSFPGLSWRVGPTEDIPQSISIGLLVLTVSFALARSLALARGTVAERFQWPRSAVKRASSRSTT